MTAKKDTQSKSNWKEAFATEGDWLKDMVHEVIELTLEAQMSDLLGAAEK